MTALSGSQLRRRHDAYDANLRWTRESYASLNPNPLEWDNGETAPQTLRAHAKKNHASLSTRTHKSQTMRKSSDAINPSVSQTTHSLLNPNPQKWDDGEKRHGLANQSGTTHAYFSTQVDQRGTTGKSYAGPSTMTRLRHSLSTRIHAEWDNGERSEVPSEAQGASWRH